MTLEQRVYEPELRDYMTEEVPTIFTIPPGELFPMNDSEAIANFTEEEVEVSIQLHMGKKLIIFHP